MTTDKKSGTGIEYWHIVFHLKNCTDFLLALFVEMAKAYHLMMIMMMTTTQVTTEHI